MKQLSQEEFESYVWKMINGEISKVKLVKELGTDVRTLNNKIQKLLITNPELYQIYLEKFPYQPKERKDLDAMQLALEILRDDKQIEEIAEEHKTGRRTIRRRLDTLKRSESDLERYVYQLCRVVAANNSRQAERLPELEIEIQKVLDKIDEIGISKVETAKSKETNLAERREYLLQIEKRYNELCLKMPKEEAAKAMGYTRNRIWKLLNELYRIEIERQEKEKPGFREGLKVNVIGTVITQDETNGKVEEQAIPKEEVQSEDEPTI